MILGSNQAYLCEPVRTPFGKFDGYSEAWSKSTFEVKSIKELMRLTRENWERFGELPSETNRK